MREEELRMQLFNYTAIDASGAEKKGQVEAISFAEALTRIKQMDLFPSEVVPADGRKKRPGFFNAGTRAYFRRKKRQSSDN
jgi:Type II secretory pathway, component PulF